MSRLFLLNVLLLVGIGLAAMKLMELQDETRRREEMVRAGAPRLPQAKPVAAAPVPEKTVAANYIEVASRLLFSKDRNPTVILTPPPVKQVPAFPLAYGVLTLTDPPIAMLAAKKGDQQKGYRPGDRIGDWKIARFDARSITLEWDGQQYTRRFSELMDREAPRAQAAPVESAAASAPPVEPGKVLSSTGSTAAKGPGTDIGGDMRACAAGDSAPAGTVQDGFRKVVSETPFGRVCRWEKVK
jgi:hypothetical protein